MIIISGVENLRDPFILVENGVYYAYGSGVTRKADWANTEWTCYKNESGRLDSGWKPLENQLFVRPEFAEKNLWAPEVHKYNGKFYMFATYFSSKTNHRGCTVLKSDSPEGPFVEISNGHLTSPDYDAIDATFCVDREGRPWMIFVREWTCTEDRIGRMAAARLSDDLTHFVTEPKILFRADDPEWSDNNVTDGCFMYYTESGDLLMLWSNFGSNGFGGYCVGIAHSSNGYPDGEWTQERTPMFSDKITGDYDGGHGMIFTALDGQKYLSVHSPNHSDEKICERMIFVNVDEIDGTLVCKA